MAFSKGQTGNAQGRPKGVKSSRMTKVSKKDAAIALALLAQTMKSEEVAIDTRTIAAAAVLGAAVSNSFNRESLAA